MPLIRINVNRITGEKITNIMGAKITYTTMFNVTLKKDADSLSEEAQFDYTLSLNSQPPGINIIISGNVFLKFQHNKELEEYRKMDKNRKASFVANMLFPQVYTTLILVSRELQIPPPLMRWEQNPKETSKGKERFGNMLSV